MPPTRGNGKICYIEIPANDARRSADFYSKVFGWNVRVRGDGHLATARRLAVHPSTLKYRLGRIREILDVDIADADVRFNVELAVRLADGMRRMAGPG